MLNTKYIIQPGQDGQPVAQRNPLAYGNAWFVDTIRMAANANVEIDDLDNFDPRQAVVVHQEYSDYVQGLKPSASGTISLTSYAPNKLTYQSNSPADNLAVFSELEEPTPPNLHVSQPRSLAICCSSRLVAPLRRRAWHSITNALFVVVAAISIGIAGKCLKGWKRQ